MFSGTSLGTVLLFDNDFGSSEGYILTKLDWISLSKGQAIIGMCQNGDNCGQNAPILSKCMLNYVINKTPKQVTSSAALKLCN